MFTFIDLFAGIGGFRIGLERLGGRCVFSSEIDKHAIETYRRNFGERPAGDIRAVDAAEVPTHDLLCGGFPCQPFSISGKRLGFEDARGTLFFEVARLAKSKQPKAVFLENVANYATHRGGATLQRTLEMLEEIGYRAKAQILNASEFGVPQARKRLYIVGIRRDLAHAEFSFPAGSGQRISLKDILLSNSEPGHCFIDREDIEYNAKDVVEAAQTRPNKPIQIGRISKGGQGERIYSVEGHAITLSAHGGGAAAKTGAYLVDGRVRKLHPIECRRAMGFPESYQINVRAGQAYKQFGNAVVANVIEGVGREILRCIAAAEAKCKQEKARSVGGEVSGSPA